MHLFALVIISSLIPFLIFLSTPTFILMYNYDYLLADPLSVLFLPFLLFISVSFILFLIGIILRDKYRKVYVLSLLSISVYIYCQTYFMNWQYGGLTGQAFDFSERIHQHIVEAVTAVFLILVFMMARRKILKNQVLIGGLLFLMNFGTFSFGLIKMSSEFKKTHDKSMYYRAFEASKEMNIFHVVLDSFQTDVFLDILRNNPDYKESFKGFTVFADNSGSYMWTSISYPLMFSAQDHSEYDANVLYGKRPFLQELYNHGFKINIIFRWVDSWYGDQIRLNGYINIWEKMGPKGKGEKIYSSLGFRYSNKSLLLIDLSLFRSLPSIAKKKIYNEGRWFCQDVLVEGTAPGFAYAYHSIELFKEYIASIRMSVEEPTYVLMHLNVPHRPFVLDEGCNYQHMEKPDWWDFSREKYYQQAHCTVKVMLKFLEKLKDLKIYDNSVIVFQSDTGAGIDIKMKNLPVDGKSFVDEIREYDIKRLAAYATPLLAVKRRNSGEPMRVSFAPVNQINTRSTILEFAGIDISQEKEEPFFVFRDGDDRKRIFVTNSWESRTSGVIKEYHEFEITGRVNDYNSWKDHGLVIVRSDSMDHYSEVSVDNATSEYKWNVKGWSKVGGPYPDRQIYKKVVWMLGPRAIIEFDNPRGLYDKLRLMMHGRSLYDDLGLKVIINDKVVGRHTFKDHRKWEDAEIAFNAKSGRNIIIIKPSKWLENKEIDRRKLSVLFDLLSIEP